MTQLKKPVPPRHCDTRIIAFDVDGTLVSHPQRKVVWEVFNRHFVGDDAINKKRFEQFRAGELTYEQWVDLDVRHWQQVGATRRQMVEVIERELSLTVGAEYVLRELRARGYRLAVVSGTIDLVLDVLLPEHPFSWIFTNRLQFADDGTIAGWAATPYDMEGKADAVRSLVARTGVDLEHFAFVGDHINDCRAMSLVPCAVAYDPKAPSVSEAANVVLPSGQFLDLLDLFPPLPAHQ